MLFLWNKRKVSLHFENKNIVDLAPFSCEMQLSFSFDVTFFIDREISLRVIITRKSTDLLTTVQLSQVPR